MYSLLLLHKAAPSQFLIQLYPFLNQKARLDTPKRRNEKRATGKKSPVGTSRAFQRKRHIPPWPPSSSPLLSPRVDQAESWRPLRCCGSCPRARGPTRLRPTRPHHTTPLLSPHRPAGPHILLSLPSRRPGPSASSLPFPLSRLASSSSSSPTRARGPLASPLATSDSTPSMTAPLRDRAGSGFARAAASSSP